VKGKVHLYQRDHINTDEIIPARYLNSDQEKDLAQHALEDLDKDFIRKVQPGDLLVAGKDFGCGSSREHAVWALRGAGIQAVIAGSFARIFFRNSINNGFPAIECPDIAAKVQPGDILEIQMQSGTIKNITQNQVHKFYPLPPFAQKIIDAGGLMNHITREQ